MVTATLVFAGAWLAQRPGYVHGRIETLGLVLGVAGFVILVYMTALKVAGHAIGQRPLLTLGVLLVVVGLQFFSLGLVGELITSQHEQRERRTDRADAHVDELLS
jgi:hypothetical protein